MRICFLGTPEFAVPSLAALIEHGHDVIGVFSQPDRPKGRGYALLPTPVKQYAKSNDIKLYQFENIKRDGVDTLISLKPDLMVTAAFGQILSKELLDIPHFGCINVHGSLLPEYRGPAPINWVIINGEKETGVTTMMTDIGVDTGDILLKRSLTIGDEETAGQLYERLAALGAAALIETLDSLNAGALVRTPQDEMKASYYPMLKKAMGEVDWSKPAESIRNMIRGVDPWPGAYTTLYGETIKLWKASAADWDEPEAVCGQILCASAKEGFFVKCGEGVIEILEMQMPNGRRISAKELLRGRLFTAGKALGT